ncbi:hypothetical protein HGRIS_006799 [Hohenbuehelia grisea]|uniref:Carboxypeptidase n=1 Tax=Hohenbuehelia grisea TaxID=104357 RepID=A0ABR3JBN1_9AGAR
MGVTQVAQILALALASSVLARGGHSSSFGSSSERFFPQFETERFVMNKPAQYDRGMFTPLETLDALSHSEYTTFGHPAFPKYNVRTKKTKFCDGTVNSYTGYIDVEARHLFFYFFESRSDPAKDDVIFWTNGGPGGSSSIGLFMELGPCKVLDEKGPTFHEHSWNSNANIFFIDQPIGVGFSYAEYGESVATTEEAAKDIAAFVAIFFENFEQFKGRAFHMAGESYGGRYLPLFAAEIYDQNAWLIQNGLTPVNLSSVMIGNGMSDIYSMLPAYYVMQCENASLDPILSVAECVAMKKLIPRCTRWMKAECIDHFDAINCAAATSFCQTSIESPFWKTGKNPYDMSSDCEGGLNETFCYPVISHLSRYLSKLDVQKHIGVDPPARGNFSAANMDVSAAFALTLDILYPTVDHIGALLEHGVRVLVYVGSYDWICNWVGNEQWTLAMEWSGQAAFVNQTLRDWTVDGKFAGRTRSAKGFTFATVHAAGHMVPYDKPVESLKLIQRWMAGEAL